LPPAVDFALGYLSVLILLETGFGALNFGLIDFAGVSGVTIDNSSFSRLLNPFFDFNSKS